MKPKRRRAASYSSDEDEVLPSHRKRAIDAMEGRLACLAGEVSALQNALEDLRKHYMELATEGDLLRGQAHAIQAEPSPSCRVAVAQPDVSIAAHGSDMGNNLQSSWFTPAEPASPGGLVSGDRKSLNTATITRQEEATDMLLLSRKALPFLPVEGALVSEHLYEAPAVAPDFWEEMLITRYQDEHTGAEPVNPDAGLQLAAGSTTGSPMEGLTVGGTNANTAAATDTRATTAQLQPQATLEPRPSASSAPQIRKPVASSALEHGKEGAGAAARDAEARGLQRVASSPGAQHWSPSKKQETYFVRTSEPLPLPLTTQPQQQPLHQEHPQQQQQQRQVAAPTQPPSAHQAVWSGAQRHMHRQALIHQPQLAFPVTSSETANVGVRSSIAPLSLPAPDIAATGWVVQTPRSTQTGEVIVTTMAAAATAPATGPSFLPLPAAAQSLKPRTPVDVSYEGQAFNGMSIESVAAAVLPIPAPSQTGGPSSMTASPRSLGPGQPSAAAAARLIKRSSSSGGSTSAGTGIDGTSTVEHGGDAAAWGGRCSTGGGSLGVTDPRERRSGGSGSFTVVSSGDGMGFAGVTSGFGLSAGAGRGMGSRGSGGGAQDGVHCAVLNDVRGDSCSAGALALARAASAPAGTGTGDPAADDAVTYLYDAWSANVSLPQLKVEQVDAAPSQLGVARSLPGPGSFLGPGTAGGAEALAASNAPAASAAPTADPVRMRGTQHRSQNPHPQRQQQEQQQLQHQSVLGDGGQSAQDSPPQASQALPVPTTAAARATRERAASAGGAVGPRHDAAAMAAADARARAGSDQEYLHLPPPEDQRAAPHGARGSSGCASPGAGGSTGGDTNTGVVLGRPGRASTGGGVYPPPYGVMWPPPLGPYAPGHYMPPYASPYAPVVPVRYPGAAPRPIRWRRLPASVLPPPLPSAGHPGGPLPLPAGFGCLPPPPPGSKLLAPPPSVSAVPPAASSATGPQLARDAFEAAGGLPAVWSGFPRAGGSGSSGLLPYPKPMVHPGSGALPSPSQQQQQPPH